MEECALFAGLRCRGCQLEGCQEGRWTLNAGRSEGRTAYRRSVLWHAMLSHAVQCNEVLVGGFGHVLSSLQLGLPRCAESSACLAPQGHVHVEYLVRLVPAQGREAQVGRTQLQQAAKPSARVRTSPAVQ